VCLLDDEKRRSVSPWESASWTACVASNQPTEREGVGPLEEKEYRNCWRCFHGRAWNRRSALESACGSPSVRRSQIWNGDLNRPRAKAISHMIMGMANAQVKQQSTSITGSGESTTVTRVPWWDGSVMVESMEFGQCSRWKSNICLKEWSCHNLANSAAVRLSLWHQSTSDIESKDLNPNMDPHLWRSVLEVQLVQLAFHKGHVCTCE